MWLASLKGGSEVIAEAATLVELHECLNSLELGPTEISVMWTGAEPPAELLEMI